MPKTGLEGLAIAIGFAFLWLPLGQHEFLYTHWMKLGLFMLPFLFFSALSFSEHKAISFSPSVKFTALLLLGAYIVHQFEEHWIDVFGNAYAFQASINDLIRDITNAPADRSGPLTPESIFVINTSLVWLVGFVAIWRAPERIFPTLAMTAITFVNGIVHTVFGLATTSYNPGLLTSVLIFLPVSWFVFRTIGAHHRLIILSLVWAVLAHIIMALGMMASTWWGLIHPFTYYATLVVWSLIPLFVKAMEIPQPGTEA